MSSQTESPGSKTQEVDNPKNWVTEFTIIEDGNYVGCVHNVKTGEWKRKIGKKVEQEKPIEVKESED